MELSESISSNNIEEMKKKIEGLKNVVGEISTEAYRAAGAAASQQTTSSPNSDSGTPSSDSGTPSSDSGTPSSDSANQSNTHP
jgi:hypothetical protein